jgi:hypothetical protein
MVYQLSNSMENTMITMLTDFIRRLLGNETIDTIMSDIAKAQLRLDAHSAKKAADAQSLKEKAERAAEASKAAMEDANRADRIKGKLIDLMK